MAKGGNIKEVTVLLQQESLTWAGSGRRRCKRLQRKQDTRPACSLLCLKIAFLSYILHLKTTLSNPEWRFIAMSNLSVNTFAENVEINISLFRIINSGADKNHRWYRRHKSSNKNLSQLFCWLQSTDISKLAEHTWIHLSTSHGLIHSQDWDGYF